MRLFPLLGSRRVHLDALDARVDKAEPVGVKHHVELGLVVAENATYLQKKL